MLTNNKVPVNIEYIDPREFVPHPLKSEVQLSMDEKPLKAKAAMDNAFMQIPDQVVPVIYTLCEIDGVIRKALLDGEVRVFKAIENRVAFVPAIKVDTNGLTVPQIFRLILTPNHTFHISDLEIGKAAARLFKLYSLGQGKRGPLGPGVDPDDVICGDLGMGLKTNRVKKARLVYEANPDLLRMVDAKEIKSLSAAYDSIRVPRLKSGDGYKDSEEFSISNEPTNDSISEPVAPKQLAVASGSPITSSAEPVNRNELVLEEDTITTWEITIELPKDGQPFQIECPCCKNSIKVTTI